MLNRWIHDRLNRYHVRQVEQRHDREPTSLWLLYLYYNLRHGRHGYFHTLCDRLVEAQQATPGTEAQAQARQRAIAAPYRNSVIVLDHDTVASLLRNPNKGRFFDTVAPNRVFPKNMLTFLNSNDKTFQSYRSHVDALLGKPFTPVKTHIQYPWVQDNGKLHVRHLEHFIIVNLFKHVFGYEPDAALIRLSREYVDGYGAATFLGPRVPEMVTGKVEQVRAALRARLRETLAETDVTDDELDTWIQCYLFSGLPSITMGALSIIGRFKTDYFTHRSLWRHNPNTYVQEHLRLEPTVNIVTVVLQESLDVVLVGSSKDVVTMSAGTPVGLCLRSANVDPRKFGKLESMVDYARMFDPKRDNLRDAVHFNGSSGMVRQCPGRDISVAMLTYVVEYLFMGDELERHMRDLFLVGHVENRTLRNQGHQMWVAACVVGCIVGSWSRNRALRAWRPYLAFQAMAFLDEALVFPQLTEGAVPNVLKHASLAAASWTYREMHASKVLVADASGPHPGSTAFSVAAKVASIAVCAGSGGLTAALYACNAWAGICFVVDYSRHHPQRHLIRGSVAMSITIMVVESLLSTREATRPYVTLMRGLHALWYVCPMVAVLSRSHDTATHDFRPHLGGLATLGVVLASCMWWRRPVHIGKRVEFKKRNYPMVHVAMGGARAMFEYDVSPAHKAMLRTHSTFVDMASIARNSYMTLSDIHSQMETREVVKQFKSCTVKLHKYELHELLPRQLANARALLPANDDDLVRKFIDHLIDQNPDTGLLNAGLQLLGSPIVSDTPNKFHLYQRIMQVRLTYPESPYVVDMIKARAIVYKFVYSLFTSYQAEGTDAWLKSMRIFLKAAVDTSLADVLTDIYMMCTFVHYNIANLETGYGHIAAHLTPRERSVYHYVKSGTMLRALEYDVIHLDRVLLGVFGEEHREAVVTFQTQLVSLANNLSKMSRHSEFNPYFVEFTLAS